MTVNTFITVAVLGFYNLLFPRIDRNFSKTAAAVYPNAEIKVKQKQSTFSVDVAKGNKVVFCIDDVNFGKIYFQISEDRRFFRCTDELMKNVNLTVVKNQKLFAPESGEVSGFKLADNIWKVDLVLNKGEESYTFSQRFYMENQLTALN